jgi:hypothetical protein
MVEGDVDRGGRGLAEVLELLPGDVAGRRVVPRDAAGLDRDHEGVHGEQHAELGHRFAAVLRRPLEQVAGPGDEHGRVELTQAVHGRGRRIVHARLRPHRADGRRRQERNDPFDAVRQVGDHPVALSDAPVREGAGHGGDLLAELTEGHRLAVPVIPHQDDGVPFGSAVLEHLPREVHRRALEPPGSGHLA